MSEREPTGRAQKKISAAILDAAAAIRVARSKERKRITGPAGIPLEVEQQIERLLRERMTVKAIARECQVDSKTVLRIAGGRKKKKGYVKCPGCGGMVIRPCRTCHIRSILEAVRPAPQEGPGDRIQGPGVGLEDGLAAG